MTLSEEQQIVKVVARSYPQRRRRQRHNRHLPKYSPKLQMRSAAVKAKAAKVVRKKATKAAQKVVARDKAAIVAAESVYNGRRSKKDVQDAKAVKKAVKKAAKKAVKKAVTA